jgi:hypothetical protein
MRYRSQPNRADLTPRFKTATREKFALAAEAHPDAEWAAKKRVIKSTVSAA